MMQRRFFLATALVLTIGGLLIAQQDTSKATVEQQRFGARDGRPVILYTLKNSHGVEVRADHFAKSETVFHRGLDVSGNRPSGHFLAHQ